MDRLLGFYLKLLTLLLIIMILTVMGVLIFVPILFFYLAFTYSLWALIPAIFMLVVSPGIVWFLIEEVLKDSIKDFIERR